MDEEVAVAVDNDVIQKVIRYGLASTFWPDDSVGVLGSARFVVWKLIKRVELQRDRSVVERELSEFFDAAIALEPTTHEIELAAQLEVAAQRSGLLLHGGESQLAAMTVDRSLPWLESGDKNAIESFESLIPHVEWLSALCGRVRCLEQCVLRVLAVIGGCEPVGTAICVEPTADLTLSICFGCLSGAGASCDSVAEGLESYVRDLRNAAPQVLAPA